ncbi:MAG: type II secretion system protein [Candidatus Firestonebacteria bacterium]
MVKINNKKGFTLIELIFVITILGVLYAVAQVVITGKITKAKETALKENLYVMRKSIDDYYADKGKYPDTLQDLVEEKYIRKIPDDPFTKSDQTWVIISSDKGNDVFDIHTSNEGIGSDGKKYNEW